MLKYWSSYYGTHCGTHLVVVIGTSCCFSLGSYLALYLNQVVQGVTDTGYGDGHQDGLIIAHLAWN
jgi:hypothetical protein